MPPQWTDPESRICLGFGETEGKCTNHAGTPWTPLWCPECDAARRAHISNRFEEISARFRNEET